MKRNAVVFVLLLLNSFAAFNQNYYDFQHRFRFAEGMYGLGFGEESLEECRLIEKTPLSEAQEDSLKWLKARILLENQHPESLKVTLFSFHDKNSNLQAWGDQILSISQFKDGFNPMALPTLINSGPPETASLQSSYEWLRAGYALANHNPGPLDSLSPGALKWTYSQQAKHNLDLAWQRHQNTRRKSPVGAGLMSAVLPGSGKIYAGNTFSGIITFITSATLGLQAWEGWRKGEGKARWTRPQFLIYGTAFAGYYLANIYGSIIQTKKFNVNLETDLHNSVLLNVVVPMEQSLRKWR